MKIINRIGITMLSAIVALAAVLLGFVASVVLIALSGIAAAVQTVVVTVIGLMLVLLLGRSSKHQGDIKKELRTIEKVAYDTHRQISELTGNPSATYLSVSTSTDAPPETAKAQFDEIIQLLQKRSALEEQVLRQIAAESRLIRMSITRD